MGTRRTDSLCSSFLIGRFVGVEPVQVLSSLLTNKALQLTRPLSLFIHDSLPTTRVPVFNYSLSFPLLDLLLISSLFPSFSTTSNIPHSFTHTLSVFVSWPPRAG